MRREIVDEEARDRLEEVFKRLDESDSRSLLADLRKHRVIVHLKHPDASIDGVLIDEVEGDEGGLVLAHASLLGPGMQDQTTATPIEGTARVPIGNVAFYQCTDL